MNESSRVYASMDRIRPIDALYLARCRRSNRYLFGSDGFLGFVSTMYYVPFRGLVPCIAAPVNECYTVRATRYRESHQASPFQENTSQMTHHKRVNSGEVITSGSKLVGNWIRSAALVGRRNPHGSFSELGYLASGAWDL